jgi:hypothetical protein
MQKWIQNTWLVILAMWEPFHRLLVSFKWPIAFAVAAIGSVAALAIVGFMWWEDAFKHKKTVDEKRIETVQKLRDDERTYLATAIIRDAMLTSEPIRVQEGVGWAVLNYRKKFNVDIPTIVKNSLTMLPLNHKGGGPLLPTSSRFVMKEASDGQITEAYALADRLVAMQAAVLSDPALSCATQYVRKKRITWSPSKEIVEKFESSEYKEVPKSNAPNPGDGRFFCYAK